MGINYIEKLKEIDARMDLERVSAKDSNFFVAKAWRDCPLPCWIKDSNGVMRYINDAYCKIYGVLADDYIGKTDYEIWPRHIADKFQKLDERVLIGEAKEYAIERVPSKTGHRSYDHLHVVKFPIKSGPQIIGVAGIITGVFP